MLMDLKRLILLLKMYMDPSKHKLCYPYCIIYIAQRSVFEIGVSLETSVAN